MAIDKAELRKLAEKATKGPWEVHEHRHVSDEFWATIGHDGRGPLTDIVGEQGYHTEHLPVAAMRFLIAPVEEQRANAKFIAASREAIPALLDALNAAEEHESAARELLESIATSNKSDVSRAYRDDARQWLVASGPTTLRDENKRLRERIEKLEAVLEKVRHDLRLLAEACEDEDARLDITLMLKGITNDSADDAPKEPTT